MACMGKEGKKEWIYVYVYQIHFARTPESQLVAGQSSTGRHWNSPKKIPHIQRQRRSQNEMVRGAKSQ